MSVADALALAEMGHCSPMLNGEAVKVLAAEVLRLQAEAKAAEYRAAAPFFAPEVSGESEPEVYNWP